MFGWGKNRKDAQRQASLAITAALNARDYGALDKLLTKDFVYFDATGARVEGRDDFLRAIQLVHAAAPDMVIGPTEFSFAGDVLMVRGSIKSSDPEYSSPSLWNLHFRGDQVCEMHAFREGNAISLPKIFKRQRDRAPE